MKAILCRTLAALVRESGIPHPELAWRVSISPRTLRHHLAGGCFPVHHIDAYLDVLDVTNREFLADALAEALHEELSEAEPSRHGWNHEPEQRGGETPEEDNDVLLHGERRRVVLDRREQ